MKAPRHPSRPLLGIDCQVRQVASRDPILLLLEWILRLKATAAEIIWLCDAEPTSTNIVQAIEAQYPSSDPKHIEEATGSFLNRLVALRAVDLQ